MGQVSLGLKRRLPSSFSFLARLRFIDPAALLIANEFWSELTIRTLDSQSVQSQSHSFCSFVFAWALVLHFSFRFRIARPTLNGPRKHYRRSLDQVSGTLIFIIVPPFTTLFLPLAITCRNTFVPLICFATSACGNYEMILLLLLGFFTSQESASRSTFNRHFYDLLRIITTRCHWVALHSPLLGLVSLTHEPCHYFTWLLYFRDTALVLPVPHIPGSPLCFLVSLQSLLCTVRALTTLSLHSHPQQTSLTSSRASPSTMAFNFLTFSFHVSIGLAGFLRPQFAPRRWFIRV